MAKICLACQAATGEPLRRITLGRQCARCGKTTPRGELMAPGYEATVGKTP